ADCVAGGREAAKLLESLGHTVEQRHPAAVDDPAVEKNLFAIIAAQTLGLVALLEATLGRAIKQDELELWTWTVLEAGRKLPLVEFVHAVDGRNALSRSFGDFYGSGFDLLLTPTLAQPPLPL